MMKKRNCLIMFLIGKMDLFFMAICTELKFLFLYDNSLTVQDMFFNIYRMMHLKIILTENTQQ